MNKFNNEKAFKSIKLMKGLLIFYIQIKDCILQ